MAKLFRIIKISLVVFLIAGLAYSAVVGNVTRHIIFKGLNTKAGPLSLDDGESPQCMNVHTNIFGALLKRAGYEKSSYSHTHVATSPGKTNGLYHFAIDSDTTKFMRYLDNKLYFMADLSSSVQAIDFASAMTNDIMEFENFDGTLITSTWSKDLCQSWDGTSSSTTSISDMPQGRHIINAYNRMFVLNCKDGSTALPLRFYFSNGGSHTTWTTSSDFETLDASQGDEGMGWGLLKGRLFGFTKYTVNLVSDVGGTSPMQVTKRIDGIGCGAPRTIQTVNIPGFGESLIWLSQDKKLYAWTGSQLKEISLKIQSDNNQSPIAMDLINTSNLKYCHAQVNEKRGWYVLWVPISSTSINYGIVYDYNTDTLWPFDAQTFRSSAVVETSNGNIIYTGDTTGGLHRWDYSTSDNGGAINAYWYSRKWDFGFSPILKKMGEIQITTKTIGEYDLTYNYRYNFSTTWSDSELLTMFNGEWLLGDVLPATLGGAQAQVHRLTIAGAFNQLQIKLADYSTHPAFEIYGMDIITSTTGAVDR